MTINNKNLFFDGVWDWAMFDDCFGETNISPTDIDGFVERKGRFLVIETKHPGAQIPDGQMITFRRLVKLGVFSVLIMWGERNAPIKAMLITRKGEKIYEPADVDKCREIVSAWFGYADTFS